MTSGEPWVRAQRGKQHGSQERGCGASPYPSWPEPNLSLGRIFTQLSETWVWSRTLPRPSVLLAQSKHTDHLMQTLAGRHRDLSSSSYPDLSWWSCCSYSTSSYPRPFAHDAPWVLNVSPCSTSSSSLLLPSVSQLHCQMSLQRWCVPLPFPIYFYDNFSHVFPTAAGGGILKDQGSVFFPPR